MTCTPALRRDKMEARVQRPDTGVVKTLADCFSHVFFLVALPEDPQKKLKGDISGSFSDSYTSGLGFLLEHVYML